MMKSKVTVAGAILSFILISMFIVACKPTNSVAPDKCANVVCKNGGICVDGVCMCVNGYEEKDCGTLSIAKYIGSWKMYDSVFWSNKSHSLAAKDTYNVTITQVPNSSFHLYISGIMGVASYTNLECQFTEDTSALYTPQHFRLVQSQGFAGPPPMIIKGLTANASSSGVFISGKYARNFAAADSTAETDSVLFQIVKQ